MTGGSAPSIADLEGFLLPARRLSLQAGARLRELLNTTLVHSRKADKSLVTNADHAANDILREGLRAAFPDHAVVSEETGREGPSSDFVWLVDPLDGTKAYARGVPGFSVMVGLLWRERPVLGVVYDPLEKHLYEALRGGGCRYDAGRRPLAVSPRREWPQMPLITSTGFPPALQEHFVKATGCPVLDPINSVGVKVGVVVRGLADVYVNHHPVHYWDTCAPALILEEAGGRFTSWTGDPLAYPLASGEYRHKDPTLATNGPRHDDALRLLAAWRG